MDAGLFSKSTQQLGRFQVVKRLGGGATHEVLLALSRGPHGFERIVVLKHLLPTYEADDSLARMLASEAVAYARLTHPAIVRLYDFFEEDGHAVLVLEYVDGLSLNQFLEMLAARREPLTDPAAFYIASRVFAALAAAHAARDPRSGEFAPVVHRDVSPGSVLLPWDGFVKLGDFGFAKVKGLGSETSNTRPGHLKGTFGYMAPEQAMGERVTPRTDVYAGCLLLRELLLGRPTFDGAMPELEFLRAMANLELPPIERLRAGLSPTLADAMRRGLARDPEARTLTAAEMMRVLRHETDLGLAQLSLVDALSRVRPSDMRPSTPPHGLHALGETPPSGTMRFERMTVPPEAMPSDARNASLVDTDSHPIVGPDTHRPMVMLGPRSGAPTAPRPTLLRRRRSPVLIAAAAVALVSFVAFEMMLREPAPQRDPTRLTSAVTGTPVTVARPPPPSNPPPAPPNTGIAPPASASASPAPAAPLAPPASARVAPAPAPASTMGDVLTPASARSHRVFVDGHYAAPRSGATLHLACGRHVVRIGSGGRDQPVDVPCGGEIEVDAR